uniref:NAD(P)(+)--arginine ADP-ribosyltransferase n=1 Tax=Chelonoidis abingdonii TaxID=106734 RepID=A0A8C0J0A2_CHEAB
IMLRRLLIPLTYFCLQTWLGIPQLSMMPDAFDDQYIGCAEEMDEIVSELLEKEKSMSSLFRTVWENAEKEWECVKKEISLPKGFEDEYGRAIVAYTDNDFHSELNAAVRGAGTSRAHYMASFHFKAFHYYLTRALQLLRGRCDVMYNMTVYRGVSARFQHTGSGDIRFGHFASSSIKEEVAERYSTKNLTTTPTLFTIQTCFGVKIWNFSYSPPDEEVLIPAHEIFNVTRGQDSNSFVLRSTNRTCSHFNCAYLGEERRGQPGTVTAAAGGVAPLPRDQCREGGSVADGASRAASGGPEVSHTYHVQKSQNRDLHDLRTYLQP